MKWNLMNNNLKKKKKTIKKISMKSLAYLYIYGKLILLLIIYQNIIIF